MTALIKSILRLWIALAALAAFALGWIGLAQSDQVADNTPSASEVSSSGSLELAPLPSLEDLTGNRQNTLPVPNFSFSAPRLRTMGS